MAHLIHSLTYSLMDTASGRPNKVAMAPAVGARGWEGGKRAQQEFSLPLRMGIEVKTKKESGENVPGPKVRRALPQASTRRSGRRHARLGWEGRSKHIPHIYNTAESAWCLGGLG